jgi:16S rRNA (uracil1498-N3)-methyltransferase
MLPVFLVDSLPLNGEVLLDGDEAHHAISVSRVRIGEHLILTDGNGARAEVEVIEIAKKTLNARIVLREDIADSEIKISVLQALTKGDRARETVELLTEAGVNHILPWNAARSIGQWKGDRESLEKWKSWAREATKQSRRSWIPRVEKLHSLGEAIQAFSQFDLVLLFHEGSQEKLSSLLHNQHPKRVLIIIGPEGGVTDEETEKFLLAGAKIASMGRPVFRSAHAGAAALAAVQTGLGIW